MGLVEKAAREENVRWRCSRESPPSARLIKKALLKYEKYDTF